jgi:uncharacterized protein involved in exopolysaccharide biosynthesis
LTHAPPVLARRWRVVALCAALGLALAYAAYLVVPRLPATAQVQVNPLPWPSPARPTATRVSVKDVSMPTEVGLVTPCQVAGRGCRASAGPSLDDLIAATSVQNPSDSLLLDVTYTASSADEAAKAPTSSPRRTSIAQGRRRVRPRLQAQIGKQIDGLSRSSTRSRL